MVFRMATTSAAGASTGARVRDARRGLSVGTVWVWIGVALPAVATLAAKLGTIDLAYQVRLGDLMLSTGHLVRADAFTFTASGRAWTDQQWLAQVLFAGVYRVAAWPGLLVLRSVLVGVTFTLVYLACRATGATRRTSALLTLASFLATMLGLALRPQLIAFALFAFTIWAVASRDAHPGRLWLVPAVVVVWANVHGTFFLAPLLLGLVWLEDRRQPSGRRLLLVAAASLAASLANPFGLGVWRYVVSISTNATITRTITEWAPPTVRTLAGVAFFGTGAATAALFARRRTAVPWTTLLLLGVFFAIGLQSGRGMFWWTLLLPWVLAPFLPDDAHGSTVPAAPIVATGVVAVTLVVGVAFLPWVRSSGDGESLLGGAPIALTAELVRATHPGARVFDAQPLGSWLEWSVPDRPVFVDSRIELFTPADWRDYRTVSAGLEGWQDVLDRWGVDAVIATRDQQTTLLPRIRRDPRWRLAYTDDDGSIFVRA
jgi:hypothetical protein